MKYVNILLASISLSVLVFFLGKAYADRIKLKTADVVAVYLCISFGLPILYIALKLIFAILMLWYYLFAAILLSLGIMSLIITDSKAYTKIIIMVLIVVTLYLFYDYRSILEIKFDVILDQKRIFISNESY